jgi:predicted exporter
MTRRALPALLLWLVALAASVAIIAHSRFTADMSAFLPRAPDAQQQVLVDQLRDGMISRLVLAGIDGANASTRAALSKALAQRLRAEPAFASVNNGEPVDAQRDYALLFKYRYVLSPTTTPQAFSVAGLHQAIQNSIDQLASPMGTSVKSLFPTDPTGATLQLLGGLTAGAPPHRVDGVWAAPHDDRALLLLLTSAAGTDTDAQQAAIAAVRTAFAAAQRSLGPAASSASLVLSGPGVFAVQSRATIKGAAERVSIIGSLLIITMLLLVYRSLPVLLLGLLPVVSGVLAAIATVSLGYGVVQGLTLGFGTTLMGEAVDYSIYLFVQSSASAGQGNTSDARSAWVRRFWPTIRLGMLTSVVGFATLLLSDFPGLAQLGAYSIAGLVAAALVTRFVLPHLLPPGFAVRDLSAMGQRLLQVVARLRRLRWLLAVLVLAACAVLLLHRHHVWNTRLSALSPLSPASLALDSQLRRQLGAPDSTDLVVVSGATPDAALAAAERIAPRLQALQAQGLIAGFDTPAHYLPSLATQRARQAALPTGAELQQRLEQAVRGLPVKPARFTPFVHDVEAARHAAPLTRADLAHTSFALALDGMLLQAANGNWSALLPLHAPASGSIDGARINAALAGTPASYINLGDVSTGLYNSYLLAAAWLSLAGLVAIALLLLVALRSPLRVARVLAPLLAAVVVVAAALLLAGVQLTLLHLVGMMLIVAVGSNYALFFDRGNAEGGGIAPRTLASLLFANLTTVAGFGPLLFSGVPVLEALGATVGPGALLALLFSAMLSAPPGAAADAV